MTLATTNTILTKWLFSLERLQPVQLDIECYTAMLQEKLMQLPVMSGTTFILVGAGVKVAKMGHPIKTFLITVP